MYKATCSEQLAARLEERTKALEEQFGKSELQNIVRCVEYYREDSGDYLSFLMSCGGPSSGYNVYMYQGGEIYKIEYFFQESWDWGRQYIRLTGGKLETVKKFIEEILPERDRVEYMMHKGNINYKDL